MEITLADLSDDRYFRELMFKGNTRALACFKWVGFFCVMFFMSGGVLAQAPAGPEFDPMDVYYQGWVDQRAAEQLEKEQDFVGALRKYEQAAKLFESVGKYYPEWKTAMVQNRTEITAKALGEVREKAGAQIQKDMGVIAELEGGEKVTGEFVAPERDILTRKQGILEVDPLPARRLKEAEAEVARLRISIAEAETRGAEATNRARKEEALHQEAVQRAREAEGERAAATRKAAAEVALRQAAQNKASTGEVSRQEAMRKVQEAEKTREEALRDARTAEASRDARSNESMRNASRVEDLRKNNDALARKLKAAEENVRSMRSRMAAAPMRSEMESLNDRIKGLEQERNVMDMALKTSRGDHTEALSKIEILNVDMEILQKQARELRQKEANLERDLATERKVANEVVVGQRRQMEQLEKALGEKSEQLKAANEQIAGLKQELDESWAVSAELRQERDGLLLEREQMMALLKLNEAGQIEELIEQNMGLAKQLREANEKVERMNVDNNAAKDDIVAAQRDLAMAKSQINRLHQEKREQDKRIQDLTEKLKNEEKALASGEAQADPAEAEMLREVIRRQLRVQERRRQAKELLVEAARDLGKEDERLYEAIELFDGAEIQLTPEEQKLVADQKVDGEFVSPFARDRATVGRNTAELNRELDSYNRAATKAYLAGRLLPARELYEMMLDQHPGHVSALCKLGVVHLKLLEPMEAARSFQKAIELDGDNGYANRMLAFCYLTMEDLPSAEMYLKRAVDLAPGDAKSYRLLGTVSYRLGEKEDAEAQFKSAISADPMPSEPYFNLALMFAKDGRLDDARKYYSDALARGAVPDRLLETKLTEN